MNRLKIFVSAYACEPGLGSEIGVGWHWVLEMSKYFELWVLTRESNRHSIEPWIREHPEYSGIHFLYYDLPKWARFWKRGLRGVRTYYNIWQKMTDRIVRETMQANGIKVFHHLTYGNALWPVSAYGSRQKFIWGPIGGLETIPGDYSRHYSRKSRLIERLRRLSVGISVRSRALKNRALRADLILCKTELTKNRLPADARLNAVSFTDVAPDTAIAAESPSIAHSGLCCIAVGRLDAWRGFDIAILAVAKALKTCPDIRLAIVGKGVDRPRLEELASKLGISEHVTFFGAVPAEIYRQLMNDTDIVLNPSLKEGAVTVSFDAMAIGKPLIALDTTGYTRYFHPDFSVVIPREDRDTTINAFADAIIRLSDPALRSRMGLQAKEAAKEITWQHHGEEIRDIILRHIDFN